MDLAINGMNIAILITDGVEEKLFNDCKSALEADGALPRIISDRFETVRALDGGSSGEELRVEMRLDKADAKAFDALLLLGGNVEAMAAADRKEAQRLITNFANDGKPIGAIAQGTLLLTGAGVEQDAGSDQTALVVAAGAAEGPDFIARFIDSVSARMQANLLGKADDNAVGIASS